jgi:hypothetical protein
MTGTDGSVDRPAGAGGLKRVSALGGTTVPTVVVGGVEKVLEQGVRANLRPEVDIVFVFDVTGSMSDKRESLIGCMNGFVDELGSLSLDWRASVLPFGDLTVHGDRVDGQLPFFSTAAAVKAELQKMPHFSGGGNAGESSIEAMNAAFTKPWRPKAVKVVVLLTDDYALQSARSTGVLSRLLSSETICFAATIDTQYYRGWAEQSGGKWVKISAQMNMQHVLDLLRGLVRDVATIAAEVHSIGAGSVRKYLELSQGK